MEPADTTAADFAKAVAVLVPEDADATKPDVRTTALSRLLDVIGAGAVPSDQQIAAAIQAMQSAKSPSSQQLIHQQVTMFNRERLLLIEKTYNEKLPLVWLGSGNSGLVASVYRGDEQRALKLFLTSLTQASFYLSIREQEISAYLTRRYPRVSPFLPFVRTYDWWRVAASFDTLIKKIGNESKDEKSKEQLTKWKRETLQISDIPSDLTNQQKKLDRLNEWMGLEIEYVEKSLTDVLKPLIDSANQVRAEGKAVPLNHFDVIIPVIGMVVCAIMHMKALGVTHNDLHEDNIRVKEFPTEQLIEYGMPSGASRYFRSKYLPVLSDFGRSFAASIPDDITGAPQGDLETPINLFGPQDQPERASYTSDAYAAQNYIGPSAINSGFDIFRLATSIALAGLIKKTGFLVYPERFRAILAQMTLINEDKLAPYTTDLGKIKTISGSIQAQRSMSKALLNTSKTAVALKPDVYNQDAAAIISLTTTTDVAGAPNIKVPRPFSQ